MKKIFMAGFVSVVFLFVAGFSGVAHSKKGSNSGGGYTTEDGVTYHSHSSRSYSGKDYMKGKAVGHSKTMKGQGQAKGHYKKVPLGSTN